MMVIQLWTTNQVMTKGLTMTVIQLRTTNQINGNKGH